MRIALTIALTLTMLPQAAFAASKASQYLMREQIAEACATKKGKFLPVGIEERDLTGDGRRDLILDHGAIQCSDGSRSLFCGAAMCSINFYVGDSKGLLRKKLEVLSIGATVKGGEPPEIELINHRGMTSRIRWNGTTFD